MIRIGTSHYVSMVHLIEAHPWAPEREAALAEGRISVGKPPVAAGGKLHYDKQGRYVVYYPETTEASVACGAIPETPAASSESGSLKRVHYVVEDITTGCVAWLYESIYKDSDAESVWAASQSIEEAKEKIEKFIDDLEEAESKGRQRWWVHDDWPTLHDGVALMCEAKDKGALVIALQAIAEFADTFDCIKLAEESVAPGVFL